MADTDKHDAAKRNHPFQDRIRRAERNILNAFTVKRETSLADGAGAPGSTAAGENRAGMPEADADRGKRD
jgi:hypothetical protein